MKKFIEKPSQNEESTENKILRELINEFTPIGDPIPTYMTQVINANLTNFVAEQKRKERNELELTKFEHFIFKQKK